MKRRTLGFMVIESCENYEQPLGLETGEGLPEGGVLRWTDGPRFLFPSRKEARAAITRTEHFRLAFGESGRPERKFCKVVRVETGNTEG